MTDIVLEAIRAVIMGVILAYLWLVGRREDIRRQEGWWYIFAGFALLFFGILLDVTDNFPSLNKYIIIGDTEYQAFLEKVVGYLLGYLLLAIGFWKWMPIIVALREAQKALAVSHDELEVKVVERTDSLKAVNEQLRQEIAERKRAEAEIARLAAVVEQAAATIVITDPAGGIVYANPHFEATSGYSVEEALGQNPRILKGGQQDAAFYRELWETITRGETWRGVFVNRRKDGSLYHEEATIFPIKNPAGEIVNYGAVKKDVTARVRAEESLQESERKFRKLSASAHDAILMVDNAGNVSFWNKAAERIFGYSSQEVMGKILDSFLPSEHYREAYREGFGQFQTTGRGPAIGETLELAAVRKDGTEFPIELSLSAIRLRGEWNAIGIIRDITERKRAEAEIARLYEMATGHAERMAALYETGTDITTILELDALLQLVAERAARLTGADRGLILLADTEAEKLTKAVGFGFSPGQIKSFTYREIQDGISGWVLRERTPTISEDILTDPRNTGLALEMAKQEPERGESIAVAPLIVKGKAIGTLTVINRVGKPVFSQDDLGSVAMLTSQAAIAIENAQLYEQLQRELAERKRAEEALREREQRFRALFERTNDAVFFISLDGIHLAANQQAADMLGYEIDELIGMSMRDVVVPDEYDDTQQKLKALLAGGSLPVYERIFRKKDGAEFPVEINVALVYDAEGNPLHLQSVVRDITERKRVEQMKDEFVSTVSHELRTPLASIMGFTEILLSGQPGELTPTQREFLDISYQNSQRLLRLVEDLLAVSRIEAGRLQLSFELLRMERLAANIVEAIKPLAEDKEIALSVESPAQLPSVEGDRKRLEQVMNNLLSNAIKFTPQGGRVAITLAREDDHIKVGVADTGVGIPPDELPRLFKKFSRASSAAERAVEGTGLGLYISRAIVERHGGRIWAESPSTRKRSDLRAGEPGEGSIFWFTLPLRQPKPAEVRQEELARDIAARFFESSEG